ncbi:MAG: histidinol-phosphatase [Clostridia bacterium]|nr:histidinol-phosphatase [Clostridia bacterium]
MLTVDFHSHILPKVDHGSSSLEASEKQLELMARHGTDLVVATSHFYPNVHQVSGFIEQVDSAVSSLVFSSSQTRRGIRLCLGAEVLLCERMDRMEGLRELCIRGTDCILIEMPVQVQWSTSLIKTVESIMESGLTVVLAHIDRYIGKYGDGIDELLSMGALAQINSDSLASFFTRKKLMPYIESGYVAALGSDLHGTDVKQYKTFEGLKKNIGEANFNSIMNKSAELLAAAQFIEL